MDDNYQTYMNRVARMTLLSAYTSQVQHLQESAKFASHPGGDKKAVSFPGYTLITPPHGEEDSMNSTFCSKLRDYQQELLQMPICSDLIIPIPPDSFHLTLADLIWDSAYRDAIATNPDFEAQLKSCFDDIFQQYQNSVTPNPSKWQMLGLMLMPRAVAICLVPLDENSYEQIINLRRAIYQNPKLIALGIEQQYNFTPHVTLGYFSEITPDLDRANFATMLSELNQKWTENIPTLTVSRAELRKFDDMTHYYRKPNFPVLALS
ncbi:DUF1868 domain-containing protein [Rivularia sp. UHCC 0363]|uniref:DUF1868 domain-containing protein n=1 Tax=Rivularia sp. UHCC 0363 TaxID=3110244 RepID=UPI002B203FC5|nr:DUF1868 domain-containing protein [Rivularia sp. UHCC 0363]MEA5592871.1 DUF1868 domain-containing protein [Rivularia sp. UHCC 0363]